MFSATIKIYMSTETIHIEPIPAFKDNYIWLLHNKRNAIVIDPGDAKPVIKALEEQSLNLQAILITHHHSDHIDGVEQLLEKYPAQVYAPQYEQYNFNHIPLKNGDEVKLNHLNLIFKVLWLPGHTLGHIAYVSENYLFCGDVLFGAGCGRLFEGSHMQMLNSLKRLKVLDLSTKVFCTHEYTAKNIDFALTLDPNNQELIERKRSVTQLRKKNVASLPSTIALEVKTNPFLRCNEEVIIKGSGANNKDELSVFTKIRTLRNHY